MDTFFDKVWDPVLFLQFFTRRVRSGLIAHKPVPGFFFLGAATKLNGKMDGVSDIFTGLGRSKGAKVN